MIALEAGSNWNATVKHAILTANGGVNGAFLTPPLSYDADDISGSASGSAIDVLSDANFAG